MARTGGRMPRIVSVISSDVREFLGAECAALQRAQETEEPQGSSMSPPKRAERSAVVFQPRGYLPIGPTPDNVLRQ